MLTTTPGVAPAPALVQSGLARTRTSLLGTRYAKTFYQGRCPVSTEDRTNFERTSSGAGATLDVVQLPDNVLLKQNCGSPEMTLECSMLSDFCYGNLMYNCKKSKN